LLRAAYDLQKHLYNILNKSFLEEFLRGGTDRQKRYAVNYTVYVIAQYFAWTEITRSEIQYIDLDDNEKTGQLTQALDEIQHLWGTDSLPPTLMIFSGEQRAIGESMRRGESGNMCVGYGSFAKEILGSKDELIDAIAMDVRRLSSISAKELERLPRLQHALMDLVKLLDPFHVRFTSDREYVHSG
jgi:hypothetical protein